MATTQTILKKLLGSLTSDKSVRAQAIWNLISDKDEDEQVELLSICFKERDSVPKYDEDLKNEGLSSEDWANLAESHANMISAHLKNSFFNSRSIKEFAGQVLRLINFYQSENEKTFCLSTALYSEYIPFHELPGETLKLTEERFNHLLNSNNDKVELIDYLVKLPFPTTTEAISHVLNIIDNEKNPELRTVLLAYYAGSRYRMIERRYSQR